MRVSCQRWVGVALVLWGCGSSLPDVPPPTPAAPPPPPAEPPPPPPDPNAPRDLATPPPDARPTPSGLVSKVLQRGTGADHPRPEDTVTVHYTGWMKGGVKFDSSLDAGQPAEYVVDRVIPGW